MATLSIETGASDAKYTVCFFGEEEQVLTSL